MTQEDRKLLLTDLCARLPYHPIVYVDENLPRLKLGVATRVWEYIGVDKPCKPYLRPMSSMTEEEIDEFTQFDMYSDSEYVMPNYETIDWLNANHFDFRGLIPKDLALIEYFSQNEKLKNTKEDVVIRLKSLKDRVFHSQNKTADKVEPKFHKGDWTVSNLDGKARQISEVHFDEYNSYYVVDGKPVNLEEYDRLHHLWTIEDAKDGDVLVTPNKNLFIFKEMKKGEIIDYCGLYFDKFAYTSGSVNSSILIYSDYYNYIPTTKEQRDLLFQKMHEAGYEWDAENKKLNNLV